MWLYGFMHLYPQQEMDLSGHFHALAILPQKKEHPVLIQ
jgi:hypothetical protein